MSILDTHSDDLLQASTNTRIEPQPRIPAEPGMFHNFGSSAGNFFMRGMAEAGRSLSMAGAVVPIALDKIVGGDNMSGQSLADEYFRAHDEAFGKAVDYWTPKPREVGAAGQIVGSLAAGLVQFLANPALAVANAQLSTSEDLVRQGVDAGPALVAGDIAGLGTVAGIALPIVGKSLAQRVATGVAGNLGQGVAQAGATQAVLKAADAKPEIVAQFDPFDARNRTIDALMGIAFGAKVHHDSRLTQTQRDAIMLVNSARHIEQASSPGRPATAADLTAAVDNTRTAIDQMLRGEPVNVPAPEASAIVPTPAPAAEMVRMYHGGSPESVTGPLWFTSDLRDAKGWASRGDGMRVWYVDIPQADAKRILGGDLPNGIVPLSRAELPPEIAGTRRPFNDAPVDTNSASLTDPIKTAERADIARVVDANITAEPPIKAPDLTTPFGGKQPEGQAEGAQAPRFAEDLMIPHPDTEAPMRANDAIAQAEAEAVRVKDTAEGLMMTAANCLLGGA